jgi:hypothetical protein
MHGSIILPTNHGTEEQIMAEILTKDATAVPPEPVSVDLSSEIEQSMERQPDERVKAVRVFDNYYRCNWWVQDKSPRPAWPATATIRRSRFIRATKTADGLLIEQKS